MSQDSKAFNTPRPSTRVYRYTSNQHIAMMKVFAATALFASAYGVPEHRALQKASSSSASYSAADLATAIEQYGMGVVTDLTEQLAQNQATGTNQLWFRSFDAIGSFRRCGEIDAAPYMPAELFEPRHFLQLLAYGEVTVRLYRTPVLNTATELGRCSEAGYTSCGASVQGISWIPGGLMGPVCGERCGCNFRGACSPAGSFPGFPECSQLPFCRDVPDDPTEDRFCSLCGPTTACPGCSSDTVTIGLCYPPSE